MKSYSNTKNLCPLVQATLNSGNSGAIPIIISYKNHKSMARGKVSSLSKNLRYELPVVNGYACEMTPEAILEINSDPNIEFISYDTPVFAVMDIAGKTIGADRAHKSGHTGKGVTVALIDTGVSPHRDIVYPTNRIVGFKDFIKDESEPYDDNGHGTHCAGILASNGFSSKGKYTGIAPEASILSVKILDENGNGTTSDILSAVQWIIDTKEVYKTKVVNFSLGTTAQYRERKDPLVKAANRAIESGMTVVAAVGNSGPARNTILSPATGRYVISVGAADDNKTPQTSDDFIASFSSRGPTYDRIRKPDLVAPGVDIMSLSYKNHSGYASLSGTSMATPMVSGVAALLYEQNPNYTHFEIKKILMETCSHINASPFDQGAGIIDLDKIFQQVIH